MLYSLTHPTLSKGSPSPLEVMDRAFFDHVKARRASPAFQSVNNPAPDFYGEKVCPSRTHVTWWRDWFFVFRADMSDRIAVDVSEVVEGSGCLYEKGDARCSRGVAVGEW
jgi:hypothetical protein